MCKQLSFIGMALLALATQVLAAEDLDDLRERANKAAVQKVAPSIVQIETAGGTDIIGSGPRGPQVRKGAGPTTGLIVSADGHVISSAFNFANKPSSIMVAVPGHKERYVAKVVATDHTRMLTLLKISAAGLPVPVVAPKKEIEVGQTALALGRTLDANLGHSPSVSVGIVSAVGRIWGKAIQTDAKVSPVNYGGPLVDIRGRVQGVLVPASPRAEDETTGIEWYDSGIGFAIPLEDINAVLPRLREGKDLRRGLLGITPKGGDIYGVVPEVATVAPDSAAARAGIKPGDLIKEIDGTPIVRHAQVLHHLGNKYEGDAVSVKIQRGKDMIDLPKLKLTGALRAVAQAFLGILPMRDDPELGVEIRYVYPKGPADAAGLKPGDRITKVGAGPGPMRPFTGGEISGRDQLAGLIASLAPGMELKLEVTRKAGAKTDTVTVKLGALPDTVPDKLPESATLKRALEPLKAGAGRAGLKPVPPAKEEAKKDEAKKDEKKDPKKKAETGLLSRTNAAKDHEYWIYVPEAYDPNIAHALLIWLHPVGKGKKEDIERFRDSWFFDCLDNHIIIAAPKAEGDAGWIGSETDFVREVAKDVTDNYTVDRRRVVAHGMGVGGQMAFYLGFHARELVRGVATTGAPLTNQPKDIVPSQSLAFFIVAGGKDPLQKAIAEGKDKLIERKFPVIYREIPEMGSQYLDSKTLDELVRWIDSLDRL